MIATLVLNLVASIVVVTALATVCRLGYRVAGGRFDERAAVAELPAWREPERRAA